jgi:hypothetical protein
MEWKIFAVMVGPLNVIFAVMVSPLNVIFVVMVDPLNVISIVKTNRCTNDSNLFYFGMTLYMFRTVFPSVIRS